MFAFVVSECCCVCFGTMSRHRFYQNPNQGEYSDEEDYNYGTSCPVGAKPEFFYSFVEIQNNTFQSGVFGSFSWPNSTVYIIYAVLYLGNWTYSASVTFYFYRKSCS